MKASIRHYKRNDEVSELVFRYVMDYKLWKKTFSEYLQRYKKELK